MTSGTVILSTEQTTFNQSLCVTDVATVARPKGQKTICLETSRLFFISFFFMDFIMECLESFLCSIFRQYFYANHFHVFEIYKCVNLWLII